MAFYGDEALNMENDADTAADADLNAVIPISHHTDGKPTASPKGRAS